VRLVGAVVTAVEDHQVEHSNGDQGECHLNAKGFEVYLKAVFPAQRGVVLESCQPRCSNLPLEREHPPAPLIDTFRGNGKMANLSHASTVSDPRGSS